MNVRRIRIRRGMSQVDLAAAVGCSPSHLCNLEHGKGSPSLSLAVRLARVLGTTMTDLTRAEGGESTGQKRIRAKKPGRVSTAKRRRARA